MHKKAVFTLCALLCLITLNACQPSYLTKMNNIRDMLFSELSQDIEQANFHLGDPAFIRIFKEEAALELWLKPKNSMRFQLFKTYPICAYSGLLGPKFAEGDKQSPEGFYDITEERLWPGSQYHLAMNIGFPNAYDQAHGRYGTNLMIHGDCKSEGCYAMTDKQIEKIYLIVEQAFKSGQVTVPVHIFPFRMTERNMKRWSKYEWSTFWQNLKQGYDLFEINRIPPETAVRNKRYIFPNYYVPRSH